MRAFADRRSAIVGIDRRGAPVRLARLRSVFALLTILAFAAQGFVAQTHIHGVTQTSLAAIDAGKTLPGQSKDVPDEPNEKHCSLCGLAAAIGSCVAPLAALVQPATLAAFLPLPAPAAFKIVGAVSHSWLGRAPPR